ncbi:MAG: hypothetical protein WAU60_17245 [Candidatus Competibacter denitrificans]
MLTTTVITVHGLKLTYLTSVSHYRNFGFIENVYSRDQEKLSIPNVNLSVADREKNSTSSVIHLFRLYCALEGCKLSQLSLNKCEPVNGDAMAFQPFYFDWTTWSKRLEVKRISENTLKLTAFEGTHRSLPVYFSFTFIEKQPFADQLIAFEAKAFTNPSMPNEEQTEYIPILGGLHSEPLDCPLLIQGLEKP